MTNATTQDQLTASVERYARLDAESFMEGAIGEQLCTCAHGCWPEDREDAGQDPDLNPCACRDDADTECNDECECACVGRETRSALRPLEVEYRVRSDGQVTGVILTLAVGGPNIYLDTTLREVRGYWGTDHAIGYFTREVAETISDFYAAAMDGAGIELRS